MNSGENPEQDDAAGERLAKAMELAAEFEPYVRQVIRLRLIVAPYLRRWFDTMEIYQSLVWHFLAKAQGAGYDLSDEPGVRGLLVKMAHNKMADKIRRAGNHTRGLPDGWDVAADTPPPDEAVEVRDLVEAVLARMPAEFAALYRAHVVDGRGWKELAGKKANTVKSRVLRAVQQARQRFNPHGDQP